MDNISHCQLIKLASPYHTRSLLSSPSLHSLSGIRVSPSFKASILYFVASFALNFSTPSFSYSLLLVASSLAPMRAMLLVLLSVLATTGGVKQLKMPQPPGIKPCPFLAKPKPKPIPMVKAQLTAKDTNELLLLETGRELGDDCSESPVCSPLGSWDEAPGDDADN